MPGFHEVMIAGSFCRFKEATGNVDFLGAASNAEAAMVVLLCLPALRTVLPLSQFPVQFTHERRVHAA